VLAVDIVPGARPIEGYPMPEACVLLFGQEGPGLSQGALGLAQAVLSISQQGSTRSINVAAAAAVAMYAWRLQHRGLHAPYGG
jgi:tRNA G18 (ribose-2'-O)-methylase SpoU